MAIYNRVCALKSPREDGHCNTRSPVLGLYEESKASEEPSEPVRRFVDEQVGNPLRCASKRRQREERLRASKTERHQQLVQLVLVAMDC